MKYEEAIEIAEKVKTLLLPHCERVEIAGSVRRKKTDVKDIEIVAIPKPFDTGLFESGIATVVNKWQESYCFDLGQHRFITVKYVHELQNLFFAVTTTELEIETLA